MKANTSYSPHTLLKCLAVTACLMVCAFHTPAHAGSCDSATKVAADIWSEWKTEIKKGGCMTVSALAAIFSEGATVSSTVQIYEACYSTMDKFDEMSSKVVESWNQLVGNKWASIGPRPIEFGKKQSGTLVSTGGRMFISASPIPGKIDEISITLKKVGGKGKASVDVCKVGADGKASKLWSFTVDSGKDNTGKTWTKTFKNVEGYVLAVHLDGKSVAKKFQYELKTTVTESKTPVAKVVVR